MTGRRLKQNLECHTILDALLDRTAKLETNFANQSEGE